MGFSKLTLQTLMDFMPNSNYGKVLTLGRQEIFLTPKQVQKVCGVITFETKWKFEHILVNLGAEEVDSCDAADVENPSYTWNLNRPVNITKRYDTIIDAGTLEHVFSFPQAISTCFKLLKAGGYFITFTPANNYCGHGFYQFSPELYQRLLPINGFNIMHMRLIEEGTGLSSFLGAMYSFPLYGKMRDINLKAYKQGRIELINKRPTILAIMAQKVAPFEQLNFPEQNDFHLAQPKSKFEELQKWAKEHKGFVEFALRFVDLFRKARYLRKVSFKNKQFFRK